MPIKVLWLIKGLGLGGAERLLALAAPHVDRTRFEVEAAFLLPWKTALVDDLRASGVPTTCLNHRYAFDLRVLPRLVRFLRERRPDVLHLHLPYTGIVGRIAGRLAGVPCVVYTEHNVQERFHPITRIANQLTISLCDLTIAVSDEVGRSLQRSRFGRRARVVTIQNGVDVEGLRHAATQGPDVKEELGLPPTAKVVGVVNVFRPQKRLDLWIRAARMIADAEPDTAFVIVGDGPSMPELRAQAAQAGLDGRIRFPGLRHDAVRLMAAFDVFMLSSVFEGLPVAVLEAMALERPVVATSVGGLPAVIEEGRHGLLAPPGDPAALAERVVSLLARPELRRAMGEAGRRRVEEHYSIQHMVRATEQAYLDLLEAAGRRTAAPAEPAT